MRLGQYPSEFFSFVVLWVAGDFFQDLKTWTEEQSIKDHVFLTQQFFGLTAESTLIPAAPCCTCRQRMESEPTNLPGPPTSPPPLQTPPDTASCNFTANVTPRPRTSGHRDSSASSSRLLPPPPALWTWRGLMSAPVMLRLTGECGIVEVRPLRVCEYYWNLLCEVMMRPLPLVCLSIRGVPYNLKLVLNADKTKCVFILKNPEIKFAFRCHSHTSTVLKLSNRTYTWEFSWSLASKSACFCHWQAQIVIISVWQHYGKDPTEK